MKSVDGILNDISVLDLSQGVSGPFCAKLLAGLGADVVKIEQPGIGDSSRQAGPFLDDGRNGENIEPGELLCRGGKKSDERHRNNGVKGHP